MTSYIGIVKAQSELFREMSETQTKELSAIISVALKESQQLSTQTIVEAMERMQKENQKFFEQQTKNAPKVAVQPVYIQPERDKTPRPIPVSPAEQEDFQIPEVNPGTENDELNELFSDENNAAEDEEELPKKKKKKKKKKNKNKDSGTETNGLAFSLFDDGRRLLTPNICMERVIYNRFRKFSICFRVIGITVIISDNHARNVRSCQTDKSDHTGKANHCSRHQHRENAHLHAHCLHTDAQRFRHLVVPGGHHIQCRSMKIEQSKPARPLRGGSYPMPAAS